MPDQFLTVSDVADVLQVSESTVRREIKAGALSATRVGKQGQFRISQTQFRNYVDERTNQYMGPHAASYEGNGKGPPNADKKDGASQTSKGTSSDITRILTGKTYAGNDWKIIEADVLDGLNHLEPHTVQTIVTSPPYYWQRDYGVEGQIGHEASIEGYVQALTTTFEHCKRVLKDDGTLFLNLGDTFYSAKGQPHGSDKKHRGRQLARNKLRAVDGPGLGLARKSLIGLPWRVALSLQHNGWVLRSDIIWRRPAPIPEPSAQDRPWRTYEHLFLFAKSPIYQFNRQGLQGEEDIWEIQARPDNPGSHFAPYPVELAKKCIACGCEGDDTVLDPFVGSGTTIVAALQERCHAIGIDLNSEFCDYSQSRIEEHFDVPLLEEHEPS